MNRDGDIPLGYAAADAYATPRHKNKHSEPGREEPRSRGRNRLRQRIHQRNAGTQHYTEQNGYDSDQSPTRGVSQEVPAQRHYGYYPQQQTTPLSSQPQGAQAKQNGKKDLKKKNIYWQDVCFCIIQYRGVLLLMTILSKLILKTCHVSG